VPISKKSQGGVERKGIEQNKQERDFSKGIPPGPTAEVGSSSPIEERDKKTELSCRWYMEEVADSCGTKQGKRQHKEENEKV